MLEWEWLRMQPVYIRIKIGIVKYNFTTLRIAPTIVTVLQLYSNKNIQRIYIDVPINVKRRRCHFYSTGSLSLLWTPQEITSLWRIRRNDKIRNKKWWLVFRWHKLFEWFKSTQREVIQPKKQNDGLQCNYNIFRSYLLVINYFKFWPFLRSYIMIYEASKYMYIVTSQYM